MTLNVNGPLIVGIDMSAHTVQEPTQRLNALKNLKAISNPVVRNPFPKALTPVRHLKMVPWLEIYPDRQMANFIDNGFKVGFHIPPFSGSGCNWVDNLKFINQ